MSSDQAYRLSGWDIRLYSSFAQDRLACLRSRRPWRESVGCELLATKALKTAIFVVHDFVLSIHRYLNTYFLHYDSLFGFFIEAIM